MTAATPRQTRLAYGAWMIVCLVWGTTYLCIRISLETMPPMLMGGLRWTAAGVILAGWMALRGERLPPVRLWRAPLQLGFLLLVLGNGGVVLAEVWVPSGLSAVMVASAPFWMAGVEACRQDGERLTGWAAAGLLTGFMGILLLVWPELRATAIHGAGGRGFLIGVIALQVACFGWSLGSSLSRRHGRVDNVFMATAAQMIAGGLMMIVLGTALGEWGALSLSWRSGTALVYLTLVGSIGAFVAYTYALRHLPVSLVSLYAYINPIIAVALGIAVLGERFTPRMGLAALLVLAGVTVVRTAGASAQARTHAKSLVALRPGAR